MEQPKNKIYVTLLIVLILGVGTFFGFSYFGEEEYVGEARVGLNLYKQLDDERLGIIEDTEIIIPKDQINIINEKEIDPKKILPGYEESDEIYTTCFNEKHSIIDHEITCAISNLKGNSLDHAIGITLNSSVGEMNNLKIYIEETQQKTRTIHLIMLLLFLYELL